MEESLGTSKSKIHEMYKTYGDLGDVAQECRQNQTLLAPPRPLSVQDVYSTLRKLRWWECWEEKNSRVASYSVL